MVTRQAPKVISRLLPAKRIGLGPTMADHRSGLARRQWAHPKAEALGIPYRILAASASDLTAAAFFSTGTATAAAADNTTTTQSTENPVRGHQDPEVLLEAARAAIRGRSGGFKADRRVDAFRQAYSNLKVGHLSKALGLLAVRLATDPVQVRQRAEEFVGRKPENISESDHPGGGSRAQERLREALEPPYNALFLAIGGRPGGVKFLVDLRSDLLQCLRGGNPGQEVPSSSSSRSEEAELAQMRVMDSHLKSLLSHWFSVGFMNLEQVRWSSSPCSMLQKVAAYEAVHPFRNWLDLKARVGSYRRCFVYTHPSMPGEPLVVLHVALTTEITAKIDDLVKNRRGGFRKSTTVDVEAFGGGDHDNSAEVAEEHSDLCTTAIFYSITSSQKGLQGIELGTVLIKQAVQELRREFPDHLKTFSTLSPIPGFRTWLSSTLAMEGRGLQRKPAALFKESELAVIGSLMGIPDGQKAEPRDVLNLLKRNQWLEDEELARALQTPLMRLCAAYLSQEKRRNAALDPVANFHLKNGATLWRINWIADLSPRGLANSFGMMVNYRYFIDQLEANSESYLEFQVIRSGEQVSHLVVEAGSIQSS